MRQLRLRMSDETIRSVMVDENQPVANLMVIICTKLGITNHDEYSLIATSGAHTIDGRRRERPQDGRIIDQKMEQLKKKLKTDEDLAWLDHSKTLDEQEVHEQDVVLLRRRFFYSDQNVDSRDPIQMGLLYVQTRDAILRGTHPATLDDACKFAGLQCQAQLGDFAEGKTTRAGFINLKDFLPADYAKQKHVERKIWSEHKKYMGLSELEAKARYVGEARSLPTYGVTFFLVKEKVSGKNKLVPRLLGITKDCVMRVDADTKAILKTWPLTTVKRWAASMNSFTLDFGDYSDSYYSVQTSEGEQISQLIAGYIDIILKRRKAKDHFGIEGDEGATMIEDSVAPSRATIIQNQPARPPSAAPSMQNLSSIAGPNVMKKVFKEDPQVEPPIYKPAVEVRGRAEIGYESRPLTQYVTNYELSLPQRDLSDRLEQAQDAVEEAQRELDRRQTTSTSLNSTNSMNRTTTTTINRQVDEREVEQKKRRLSNQFAKINAATAELVSLSAIPEEELNYPALNQAVETVAQSLPTVAREVKIVASLMDDEASGDRLIEAARKLCKAFSDLLNAAEPGPTVPRQSLISAASRVGDATQALLCNINEGSNEREQVFDEEAANQADNLLALAKSVASSAASLVLKAKDIAKTCQDEELRNRVISAATQCALATSQMVATAKIVAPTIQDPACQRKLIDSCREVQRAVDGIQQACRDAIRDEQLLCRLREAASRVNSNLDELMEHVRTIKHTSSHTSTTNKTTTTITTTTTTESNQRRNELEREGDTIPIQVQHQHSAPGSPEQGDLIKEARIVAQATAKLIEDIRPVSSTSQYQHQQPNYNNNNNNKGYLDGETIRNQHQQRLHLQRTTTTTNTQSSWQDNNHHHHNQVTSSSSGGGKQSYNQQSEAEIEESQYLVEPPEAVISGIVSDLETTIVFASSGTLRCSQDKQHDNYQTHRENVLRCAKALVDDTRPLVASQAANERELAQHAQQSVLTMTQLADTVKASAASLGPNNAESQVNLIKSVKGVAMSLSDLIGSTKSALGCEANDPRSQDVQSTAKTMVSSVTNLLKTVKTVEDEQQRGVRAIETALEAIEQDLARFQAECSQGPPVHAQQQQQQACSPEELIRVSRHITMATAKTVHATSSGQQDDAIVAANMGAKATRDLLTIVRLSSFFLTESYEMRMRVQEAGGSCAVNFKQLLEQLHRIFQHPSIASANPEIKQDLIQQSKIIGQNVQELIQCGELLKDSRSKLSMQDHQDSSNWTSSTTTTTTTATTTATNILNTSDLSSQQQQQQQQQQQHLQQHQDPTVIAESELLGAASSIDAAARKLENLKPRVSSVKLPHEDLNFDEIILDAAKSIIEATAALLRAASASQRELIVDGRLDETETFYASDNNQWSEGLISAARMVAAATHSLVEAANSLVQGQASEERLISAAKQVASSTNQLLVACKVKADPDSRTMMRLSNAGNQVKRATDNLVRAAQQAIEHDEEQSLIISNKKVSGIAQEISAREQILRKEKELHVAKTQLMAIRKAKYANRPDDYQGYGGSLD